MTDVARCELCGRSVEVHDRHIRFARPDPVADVAQLEGSDLWMSGNDANESVMMQVNHLGAFVRALLPVKLTAGYTVTYGVWVALHPSDMRHAFDIWWSPQYEGLTLEGSLANAIEPWGLLGAPVRIEVLNPEHTPYCVSSNDGLLQSVMTDEWEHDLVLSTLPRL